jgi:hypothetical protein
MSDTHKPYMLCSSETECITGEKCGLIFLKNYMRSLVINIKN